MIIENFLTDKECDELIRIYQVNEAQLAKPFGKTYTFALMGALPEVAEPNAQMIKYVHAKLSALIQHVDNKAYMDYFQLVKWPEKSSMDPHIDQPAHQYTSLIYLNDDYEGGETVVESEAIKPKKGMVVVLKGNVYTHGVNEVTSGTRFMLSAWYKAI